MSLMSWLGQKSRNVDNRKTNVAYRDFFAGFLFSSAGEWVVRMNHFTVGFQRLDQSVDLLVGQLGVANLNVPKLAAAQCRLLDPWQLNPALV